MSKNKKGITHLSIPYYYYTDGITKQDIDKRKFISNLLKTKRKAEARV